jgi:hypothetical protein
MMFMVKARLRVTVLAGALSTLATTVATATPMHSHELPLVTEASGLDGCLLVGNASQTLGSACDPSLNRDGDANALDLGAVPDRFITGDSDSALTGQHAVVLSSMAFGQQGQGYVVLPRGPNGVPVSEPGTGLLLLAGSLAWRIVRRRRS